MRQNPPGLDYEECVRRLMLFRASIDAFLQLWFLTKPYLSDSVKLIEHIKAIRKDIDELEEFLRGKQCDNLQKMN